MHKTLTQTLLAAFCAILAAQPLEGGGVMVPALRNTIAKPNGGNPYQTPDNALLVCIDGIYNSEWGVHSDAITSPVDLMGNIVFSTSGQIAVNENNIYFNGSTTSTGSNAGILAAIEASSASIMVGFHQDNFTSYNGMFQCAGRRGLGYYSESGPWTMSGVNWRGRTAQNPGGIFYTTNGRHYSFIGLGEAISVWINGTKERAFTDFRQNEQRTNQLILGQGYNQKTRGRLYYLRFYNRALTDDEVRSFSEIDIARYGDNLS